MKAIVVVAVLVLFQNACLSSASSLEETCKSPGIDYNFCITSLQVDPGSQSADTRGLAIIATNLIQANLTHNKDLAKQLMARQDVSAEAKKALSDCTDNYDDAASNTEEAVGMIKWSDINGALTYLSADLTDIDTCLTSWKESKAQQPLMVKENDDAYKLCSLALGIASLLK